MNKQLSKKQRIHYFLMNLISFASIFLVLGIIVFQLLQTSIYQTVDDDLRRWTAESNKFINRQIEKYEMEKGDEGGPLDKLNGPPPNNSFQQQVLLWSAEGEILNENELGSRFYDFQNLKLSSDQLNEIVSIKTENSNNRPLQFRSITLEVKNSKNVKYVQLLVNTDPIQGTVDQFRQILIICMVIFSILSIVLSYFLAQKAMNPILSSWKKQQEFVENASHELRTPLAIIQAKLENLFTKPNHTIIEESESIALSLSEVQRLEQLTNDLLLLARSDSNAVVLEKGFVSINDFLHNVLSPYKELAAAEGKSLMIDLTENKQVAIDKKRVHQLIIILLDNALKYTPEGGKIVVHSTVKNGEWQLQVKDTGIGISDQQKQEIFERFYRGDQSRNRKTGGYGLGLSIAKWIATAHLGKIEVEDNEPRGSIFIVRLPVK